MLPSSWMYRTTARHWLCGQRSLCWVRFHYEGKHIVEHADPERLRKGALSVYEFASPDVSK
jgi:hypothetical protein